MSETIGEKLKRAREEKRLTIAQVAEQTRIRSHYLEALERDDLSSIPSAAQVRGFLRNYSDFLGLKTDALPADVQPSERTLAYQPSASSLDASTLRQAQGDASLSTGPQADPVQEAASAPEPARPNLLNSLRERFVRREDSMSAEAAPDETVPASSPEPEPFVPIRYTEELPAAPEPQVEEPPAEKISTPVTKPSRKKSAATNSKTLPIPRRKSAKPRAGASKTGDKQTVVKKKITRTPPKKKKSLPKRGSLPRKLNSSHPHRPLTKMKKTNSPRTIKVKSIRKTSRPLSGRKSKRTSAASSPKGKKSRKK